MKHFRPALEFNPMGFSRYDIQKMSTLSASIRDFAPLASYELRQGYRKGEVDEGVINMHLNFWKSQQDDFPSQTQEGQLVRKEIRALTELRDDLPKQDLVNTSISESSETEANDDTSSSEEAITPELSSAAFLEEIESSTTENGPLSTLEYQSEVAQEWRERLEEKYPTNLQKGQISDEDFELLKSLDDQQFDTVSLRAGYNDLLQKPLDELPIENREQTEKYIQVIRQMEDRLSARSAMVYDDARKDQIRQELAAMKIQANQRLIDLQEVIENQLDEGELNAEDFSTSESEGGDNGSDAISDSNDTTSGTSSENNHSRQRQRSGSRK